MIKHKNESEAQHTARVVCTGASILTCLGVSAHILTKQIGPRIMWASDACPDEAGVCGILPLGILLGSIAGALVMGVGQRLISELFDSNVEVEA